ncbi:MAG: DEAD/DEAH box helicase, partial [Ardenticatenia bacterium]|nr:DEAD/DEAH box helicase [Ardenticatenia bacterium]
MVLRQHHTSTCSRSRGELRASLRFGYGDYEVEYSKALPAQSVVRKPGTWTLVRLHRNAEAEHQAYKRLSSHGLKRGSPPGTFLLRKNVKPVDFLIRHVPRLLAAGYEVYGEERLNSVRVNRHRPTISLCISSEIDWFDVKAVITFGKVPVSLKEVRRALRKRQRYVKLADGSIGEIPPEWIKRYRHLFELGEVDVEEERVRLASHHALLLEELASDSEVVEADARFREQLQRLQDFTGIEPRPVPRGFVGQLRPYQKAGYDWLHFLHEYEFGGCLADDMGLGKTVQVLAFLLSLRESGHAQAADLIVVPRSLLVNWDREAARFTPSLRVLVHAGSARSKSPELFDQYDLVVTTYGLVLRDLNLLRKYHFHYVVLDESQAIKNPVAKTSRAVRRLESDHRLALTGTPVENTSLELWSQFAFLNPGMLGSLEYFKREFATPIERHQDQEAAHLLQKMVHPFILRRTKEQVAPELPPRTERIIFCDMEPAQRRLYERWRDRYRAMVLGLFDEVPNRAQMRMKVLEGLLRLRQIAIHPLLVEERFRGRSAKMELLAELLETLRAEGHKVLVFSQFVQVLKLIRQQLERQNVSYAYLDGRTRKRQAQVDRFQNDPAVPFFLISLKAGGLGLNLTAADYVIHIDPWWNPAVEAQA